MAEPLKNYFKPDIAVRIGDSILAVDPGFDRDAFVAQAVIGFDELELTPRARQIAAALAAFLPDDRARALDIVVGSLGPELENCDPAVATHPPSDEPDNPIPGFFYMPHSYFISDYCAQEFAASMRANYELTKRFTAEFSIRACLRDHTDAALAMMQRWTADPNVHVRRLVSEGTRPRLPWAPRLPDFQRDPGPVIELLEELKDDRVEYVRRSVANNLNDIAKDHPGVVIEVTRRWWATGDDTRRRLVRHALRTLIKAGDPDALEVLGYRSDSPARLGAASISPALAKIGDKVRLEFTIENPDQTACAALVDLRVHFVKANGATSPKVFKGAEVELEPGGRVVVRKTISLAQHSTRTHYRGRHDVDVLINGAVHPAGSFVVDG